MYTDTIDGVLKGAIIGFLYVAFFVVSMTIGFYLTQSVLYVGTTRQLINNAIRFTFGMFGWNILIFLIVLLPLIIIEIVSFLPSNFFLIEYIISEIL